MAFGARRTLEAGRGWRGRVAFVDPGAPAAFSISVGARVAWEQGMLDASLQRGLLIMWLGEQREATKMLERFPRPFGLASMLELGWVLSQLRSLRLKTVADRYLRELPILRLCAAVPCHPDT